jgi:hypothetical protein
VLKSTIASIFLYQLHKKVELPCDYNIIYGDTDSIFIHCPDTHTIDANIYGQNIASLINGSSNGMLKIRLDAVFKPFILFNKKSYIGYTNPLYEDPGELVMKGIFANSIETCIFVKDYFILALRNILSDGDIQSAFSIHKNALNLLLKNEVDINLLKVSKYFPNHLSVYRGIETSVDHIPKKIGSNQIVSYNGRLECFFIEHKKAENINRFKKSSNKKLQFKSNVEFDYTTTSLYGKLEPKLDRYKYIEQLNRAFNQLFQLLKSDGYITEIPSFNSFTDADCLSYYTNPLDYCFCGNKKLTSENDQPVCKKCSSKVNELYHEKQQYVEQFQTDLEDLFNTCKICKDRLVDDSNRCCYLYECSVKLKKVQQSQQCAQFKKELKRFEEYVIHNGIDTL